jgi:hypothetical protein
MLGRCMTCLDSRCRRRLPSSWKPSWVWDELLFVKF